MRTVLAVLFLLWFGVSTLVLAALIVVGYGLSWLVIFPAAHRAILRGVLKIPVVWTSVINSLLRHIPNHQWEIQGNAPLNPKQSYLLFANHQTWLDILVLGYAFNRKIPIIKFFMKKELLWSLPITGLACWILDYPFMQRHSHKAIQKNPKLKHQDIEATIRACQKLRKNPATITNFLEGTRFTAEKQHRQRSPYLHLLKPKAGGIARAMHELRDVVPALIDVSIYYSAPSMSLWKYFLGVPCRIIVHYDLVPVTPDLIGNYDENREFRKIMQQWLNGRWKKKDDLLTAWHNTP